MQCVVYKSQSKEGYYLYVDARKTLQDLPDNLVQLLGALEKVMDLELTPERRLAQVDVARVLDQLALQGYFLQMPPRDYQAD